MKKDEIKVGSHYSAKVSGRMATVRIDAENARGGWDATNLRTGKKVRIKSAQRLRHETRAPGQRAPAKPDAPAGPKGGNVTMAKPDAVSAAMEAVEDSKQAGKPTKASTCGKGRDTGQRRGTSGQPKRLSALDAAVKVLEERDPADGPLSCKQMIERMAAKGYWTPVRGGKTPANTLYAAILREINTKGKDSRFVKVERGRFALGLKR